MKVGNRLQAVLDELEARGLTEHAVFVSRRGSPRSGWKWTSAAFAGRVSRTGYLSILIIQATPPQGADDTLQGRPSQ